MKKKAVSCLLVLAAIMTLTPSVPTLAAETSSGETKVTQELTQVGSNSATLTYEQASVFTVTIPKAITLGGDKSAVYDVKVKGDIAGNETVTVTPDATVVLQDANGKSNVTGQITQTKVEFTSDEIVSDDGSVTGGNIAAEDLTAGNWSGTFNFTIGLESGEQVTDVAGLYDDSGKLVCTWEESGINLNATGMSPGSYNHVSNSCYSILKTKYPQVTKIKVPDDATNINSSIFVGCSTLKTIEIPDSITTIGTFAFRGCTSLIDFKVPNNINSIDSYAFQGCTGFTSITIPESVTNIGVQTFGGCTNLANVTYKGNTYNTKGDIVLALTENGVSVGEDAFAKTGLGELDPISLNSTNLSTYDISATGDVVIPAYVKGTDGTKGVVSVLGTYLFYGNESNVTSVKIPNTVTSINALAFQKCTGLTSLTLPNDITEIGDGAFNGCSNLNTVRYNNMNYTNKTKLENELKNKGVTLGRDVFSSTGLK